MQATFTAIRAIGAEYARRILLPMITIGILAAAALLAIGGWLTTQSAWWWILEAIIIIGTIICALLTMMLLGILQAVAPALTKNDKKAVRQYVNKLERVSEGIGTPQMIIVYRVVRDTIRPTQHGFIETISHDSKTLASDFANLRDQLNQHQP